MPEDLELIWDQLLSRKPGLVRTAFVNLDEDEQHAVLAHLRRMTSESGWQPSQRESAQAALEVLRPEDRQP
jgi:hypothetical protein